MDAGWLAGCQPRHSMPLNLATSHLGAGHTKPLSGPCLNVPGPGPLPYFCTWMPPLPEVSLSPMAPLLPSSFLESFHSAALKGSLWSSSYPGGWCLSPLPRHVRMHLDPCFLPCSVSASSLSVVLHSVGVPLSTHVRLYSSSSPTPCQTQHMTGPQNMSHE